MNRVLTYNLLRFFALLFVQVVLLKNITIYNLNIPLPYILFIFLLPFKTPNWLLFLLAFTMGLCVDIFSDTLGLNAIACTIIAFFRIFYLSVTVQHDPLETEITPNLSTMHFRWFFFYTLFLTLIHHFFLFFFEVFDVTELLNILVRVLVSTSFTLLLIFTTELLFYNKKAS
jgi:rod shape-determining protein MreD